MDDPRDTVVSGPVTPSRPGAAAWLPYAVTLAVLAIGTAVVFWGEFFGYPDSLRGVVETMLEALGR